MSTSSGASDEFKAQVKAAFEGIELEKPFLRRTFRPPPIVALFLRDQRRFSNPFPGR